MRVFALFLALVLAVPVAGTRAQDTVVTADTVVGADQTATVASSSGLPAQNQPPRTLRAYWHLFAAFTFAWLMILGYAISLARRFRRLEERIDAPPRDVR